MYGPSPDRSIKGAIEHRRADQNIASSVVQCRTIVSPSSERKRTRKECVDCRTSCKTNTTSIDRLASSAPVPSDGATVSSSMLMV